MFVSVDHYRGIAARSPLQVSEESRTAYLSNTISSLIGCIIPILALFYLSVVSWIHRYSQRHSRPLNKISGVRMQRYAPRKCTTPLKLRLLMQSNKSFTYSLSLVVWWRQVYYLHCNLFLTPRRRSFTAGAYELVTPSIPVPP